MASPHPPRSVEVTADEISAPRSRPAEMTIAEIMAAEDGPRSALLNPSNMRRTASRTLAASRPLYSMRHQQYCHTGSINRVTISPNESSAEASGDDRVTKGNDHTIGQYQPPAPRPSCGRVGPLGGVEGLNLAGDARPFAAGVSGPPGSPVSKASVTSEPIPFTVGFSVEEEVRKSGSLSSRHAAPKLPSPPYIEHEREGDQANSYVSFMSSVWHRQHSTPSFRHRRPPSPVTRARLAPSFTHAAAGTGGGTSDQQLSRRDQLLSEFSDNRLTLIRPWFTVSGTPNELTPPSDVAYEPRFSIWAPRESWSDGRSFFDDEGILLRRFTSDMRRALQLGLLSVITRSDESSHDCTNDGERCLLSTTTTDATYLAHTRAKHVYCEGVGRWLSP